MSRKQKAIQAVRHEGYCLELYEVDYDESHDNYLILNLYDGARKKIALRFDRPFKNEPDFPNRFVGIRVDNGRLMADTLYGAVYEVRPDQGIVMMVGAVK